jgi:enoyl-CoA hydratase
VGLQIVNNLHRQASAANPKDGHGNDYLRAVRVRLRMNTQVAMTVHGPVAELTLSAPEGRPPALNATTLAEMARLLDDLAGCLQQDAVAAGAVPRVLRVGSASPKYFCVGADLRALQGIDAGNIGDWVRAGHAVFNRLEDLPIPVIAAVSGYAMGGGLELAMACDVIFAADEAVFGQTEARLGFVPGWGGARRLRDRVGDGAAKRLFYSGATIDGRQAAALGLADLAVPAAGLEAAVDEFCAAVAGNSAGAITGFKEMFGNEERAARQRNLEAELLASERSVRDPDTQRRLQDFFAARASRRSLS